MPRPNYTLYVPEASFRAFAILIAAEYNGVTINVNTDISNASKSPVRKLPILELNDGETCIFSSQASTRYVASIRHDVGLMGQSAGDAATIDAWMDWCTADIELPACVWFYPVAGYMPFNAAAYVFLMTFSSSGSFCVAYFYSYLDLSRYSLICRHTHICKYIYIHISQIRQSEG